MNLRTRTTVLILAAAVLLPATALRATEFNEQRDSHPVRLVTRLAFPIARAFEWAIVRPFEYLTSRDHADVLFGNMEHMVDERTYFDWSHGDYTPSIAGKRAAAKPAEPAKAKETKTKEAKAKEPKAKEAKAKDAPTPAGSK